MDPVEDATRSPETEAARYESEARYQTLAESLPDLVFILDRQGCVQYANAIAARVLGRTPPELAGRRQAEVFPPPNAQHHAQMVERVFATGETVATGGVLALPGGEIWLDYRFTPLRNAAGEITAVLSVARDVTERQRAEAARRRQEQKFRALVEYSPDGISLFDETGRLIEWNAAMEEMTGLKQAEALGRPIWEIQFQLLPIEQRTPQAYKLFESSIGQLLQTGQSPLAQAHQDLAFQHPDGTRRFFQQVIFPIPTDKGYMWGNIARDITDRKAAELALRESQDRLELALESGQADSWEANLATGDLTYTHKRTGLLGYAPGELPGRIDTLNELIHPDDGPAVSAALRAYVEGQTPTYETECRMRSKRGDWVWIVSRGKAVSWDAAGRPERLLGVNVNITSRKLAEEEIRRLNADLEQRVADRTAELRQANEALIQALRVKDEFLAAMSHELRTPLSGVLGLADALQLGVYGPVADLQRQPLEGIRANGQHLLDLIVDVLDFARAGANQLPLALGEVEVNQVCQAALRFVRPSAQQKKLKVALDQDLAVSTVWADGHRLKQMLIRLLTNAVKFTPEGGAIGLEVAAGPGSERAGREVRFTVWDTGIGIAPEDQARLFEPFVQLDSGLARKYEGVGLGLALVRRLAELHGGRLTVESPGTPGQGSRFTLALPRAALEAEATGAR